MQNITNIDSIIKEVNLVEAVSAKGNKYSSIQIVFDNDFDISMFPQDRLTAQVIKQELKNLELLKK